MINKLSWTADNTLSMCRYWTVLIASVQVWIHRDCIEYPVPNPKWRSFASYLSRDQNE